MYPNNSDRLKLIREAAGNKTQVEFAKEIGFPLHKIKSIEAGKTKISVEMALAIEEKFNFSFRWMLTGRGEITIHDPLEGEKYSGNDSSPVIYTDYLEEILIGIEVSLRDLGEKLSSVSRAKLIAILYQMRADLQIRSMGYSTDLELATIKSMLKIMIAEDKKRLCEDENLKDDVFLN